MVIFFLMGALNRIKLVLQIDICIYLVLYNHDAIFRKELDFQCYVGEFRFG